MYGVTMDQSLVRQNNCIPCQKNRKLRHSRFNEIPENKFKCTMNNFPTVLELRHGLEICCHNFWLRFLSIDTEYGAIMKTTPEFENLIDGNQWFIKCYRF